MASDIAQETNVVKLFVKLILAVNGQIEDIF